MSNETNSAPAVPSHVSLASPLAISARAALDIRNRIDPVNPSSGLRRSEVLYLRRQKAAGIISDLLYLARTADAVSAPDREAFGELVAVARRAIQSADHIIETAALEITQAIARAEEATK